MKNRKAFLAKVLAAAVAVTTVLPGAITANAATVITTTSKENAEKTDTWAPEMKAAHLGGEAYWHLQSSATTNNNNNSDYSLETAPAVILDLAQDLTVDAEAEKPDTVSVDIYPNGTSANMRFGIMVKYVDPTHWAYLNYDVGRWLLEYKCDSINNYPTISELGSASLSDNQDTRVTVTYTAADQLDITYTPQGGDTITASIKDESYDNVLSALETYAATAADGEPAPIRFGFKAGTFSTNVTDVNLKNMELNGESMMTDEWGWVLEREGQVFEGNDIIGGQDYMVVDASEAQEAVVSTDTSVTDFENGTVSAVIRATAEKQAFAVAAKYTESGAIKVGYDGTTWYYTVGSAKTPISGVPALTAERDFVLSMTVEKGKLSANVIPADVEEGTEAVSLVSDADVTAVAAGSIALEAAAGTELWVRSVNYTKKTASAPTALQDEYDRVLALTGTTNTDNKYYSDKWEAYQNALSDVKDTLDQDIEITPASANEKQTALTAAYNGLALVDKTNIQSKYDELKVKEQGLATDESWAEFQKVLTDAKAVLDKIDGKQSVTSTEVSDTQKALNNAEKNLVERPATKEEKAGLQAAYDSLKAEENKYYTDKSWKAFTKALEKAEKELASETSTNTQVKAALDALNAAFEGLTAETAGAEDLQELLDGYDSVKATVNAGYTAESWKAFQNALVNAEAMIAKGEDATKYEVKSALENLQTAKAALTVVKVSFAQTSYTVEATATVATKVEAAAAVTYTSSDTSVATVDAKGVITGVKAGKAVITAESAGVKVTAAVTVTTPKITLTANKASLQVKKSTKAIQVETKLATDSVVSWKSSNTKVATVTKAGKVKAKKVGTTKLTVTMKSGATATCTLKVQKKKVVTKSIKVAGKKVTLSAGQTYSINAKRNPITAAEKITYTSNKKKVAAVSKKGVITAKAKGTAKITVKCNGKKQVVTVTVK